jgi:hypothetical protein
MKLTNKGKLALFRRAQLLTLKRYKNMSSVAHAIKSAFLSVFHGHEGHRRSECCTSEMFGEKVRRAYHEGRLQDRIQKAEIDYAEGRALDRLY